MNEAGVPGWWTAALRTQLYAGVNLAYCLGVSIAGLAGPAENPRALYLCLLMLSCSSPILWMERLNGRFTLLGVFLAAYFAFYGLYDTAAVFGAQLPVQAQGIFSEAELAIVLGAALAILGYHAAAGGATGRATSRPARDWPMSLIVVTGIAFWCAGTATDWYWQMHFTSTDAFEGKSGSMLIVMVIARMLQPLGTIMVGYALVSSRNRALLALVVAMMALQAVVGFIGNSKETAMRGLIILIMSAFLLRGRVPKAWIGVAVAFVVLAFPIFQAYRAEVIGVRGISRATAATDIVGSFKLALGAKEKVQKGFSEDYRAPSFLERSALKSALEMFMLETGKRAEFQHGYTLYLYFTGFVPRIFWPDKPDSSVGKLVNREFHVSEDPNTYISATHLGELYWNFGWPGIVVGMFALGFMLGFINARCDLSEKRTLTRLLVLITTIYATVVRFEGSIALEYIVLTRSLIVIWVMHVVLARIPVSDDDAPRGEGAVVPQFLAPQLMR